MVYVDESGNVIENPDLNAGHVVDYKWVDHPAQAQEGHYEYRRNERGGMVQTYVIDRAAQAAWREVTVQMYIPLSDNEEISGGLEIGALEERVYALEEKINGYESAYAQGVTDA